MRCLAQSGDSRHVGGGFSAVVAEVWRGLRRDAGDAEHSAAKESGTAVMQVIQRNQPFSVVRPQRGDTYLSASADAG